MFPTVPYQYAPTSTPAFPTFNPIQTNIPEIQYVNSPESADAFNLPPNKTVVLFNSNNDEFYIVQSDASGSRTRTDFTFVKKAKDSRSEYVTRGEFEDFKASLDGPKKTTKKAQAAEVENE